MGSYLNTTQLAEKLQVAPITLMAWRCRGKGPRWHKVGHKVLYSVVDVHLWLEQNARYSTKDAIPSATA